MRRGEKHTSDEQSVFPHHFESLHVGQILLKKFSGTQMNLIGFQPDATFHQDLVYGIFACPSIFNKVTNLRQTVVS